MDCISPQPDGSYALTFKNFNNLSMDDAKSIFEKYGNVVSIRKSTDKIAWVFIRYKFHEEALSAFTDLQSSKLFSIRVATSGKKTQEKTGSEKADPKEKGNTKGIRSKNSFAEQSFKDNDEDNDDMDAVRSPIQRLSSKGRVNQFMENSRTNVDHNYDDEENDDNDGDDELEAVVNPFKKISIHGGKKFKSESREEAVNHSSSQPRFSRKSRNISSDAARSSQNHLDGDGPPKLVKAAEFYGNLAQENPFKNGLACRAAFNEVWANHSLRSEMQLREVILTNFRSIPTKLEITELCSCVNLRHISIHTSPKRRPYCRVLVSSEEEVEELYKLHGCEYKGLSLYVSSVEYIIDELW